MNYTAENFESDMQEVAYSNNPLQALNQLKRLYSKIKSLVESKYKFRLGKVNTEKDGKNYYVIYPVIGEGVDEDKLWNTVEKPLSSDVIDLIDEAKLQDVWEYEGIRQGNSGDIVEILLALK
jgi:hypothetical protein